jgi:membrane protease YdiL (CAAX protease family)
LSDPQNSFEILPPEASSQPESFPPVSLTPRSGEDPPWGIWEILGIVLVTISAVIFFMVALILAVRRFLYPHQPLLEVAQQHALLVILAQALAYVVVIGFMTLMVKGLNFWSAVKWNWPTNPWVFLMGGVALSVGLQLLGHFLPMPKEVPIDKFFQTPAEAWALAIFGLTFAPLMEELFFRGFLYPVLARWLGVGISIVLTGIGFGLIHASQLGRAWAPVFVIFLVGAVLTTVRATTKSVASSFLMHFAYNGTIFSLMFIATGGFRHLERLNQ